MKFTLLFTQTDIIPAKKEALQKLAQNVNLKGFRPGKAPLDLVEQHIGSDRLIEETASFLLPKAYSSYISDNKLKPITQPKISLKKVVNDGDWEFEVEIAEKPEVKLNKYQDAIKTVKAKDAIWTPGKDEKPEDAKEAESKKLNLVLDTLLKTAEVEVPQLLVDEEVNHSLSHLIEQVDKLGLKIDQYLSSVGKTAEALRKDYEESATSNLKLEFILDAIASDQKVEASEAEVETALSKTDAETAKMVKNNPLQLANLKYALVKQKVVDYLLHL